MTIFIIQHT